MNIDNFLTGCLFLILVLVILVAIEGFVFMFLWNWLVPLFWNNAPILSFWQSCGILFLFNLIFSPLKKSSNK